jgi:hypothetical protein
VAVGREPYYDTAQVCLNGHVITARATRSAYRMQDFCDQCGEPTIVACPNCDAPIRGFDLKSALAIPYTAPGFCHACGNPYPWTERRLAAAKEYADELEKLDQEDSALLKQSLDADTPQAKVAAVRIKKVLAKVGPVAGGMLRDLIVDFASETAKKIILQ